ncbi:MAG TPA: hypothetical protein VF582_07030 [Allosphingosinicella sp.]
MATTAIGAGLLIVLAACGEEAADRNQAAAPDGAPMATDMAANDTANAISAADPHAGHDMNDMNAMNAMNSANSSQ